ncbi:MAG: tetratricopeptide repeat protein [Anaerolineae bacterium]
MRQELRLTLLGGLQIGQGGAPVSGFVSSKVQALLCYLAVTGRPHLRPALAGLLWGGMSEESANTNLRQALSNLNKLVGEHLIVDRGSVALDLQSAVWLDVEVFERGIEGALRGDARRGAGPARRPTPQAIGALAETVALYRGEFLAGFHVRDALAFEEWALVQREQLRELALQALQVLTDHHAARGENAQALTYGARLLALEPWREDVHRRMMLLLARSGRRSAALAQYQTCRTVLAEELDVEPMAETTALYERIRALSARRVDLPAQPTPFVGREEDLAQITGCFDGPDCRLLSLVGPGGIGKSRLAIEVAASRADAFLHGVFFVPLAGVEAPGRLVSALAEALGFSFYGRQDPRAQLLEYLRDKELLLVLDNFEHLLIGEDDAGVEVAGMLTDILEEAPRVKLLVTSRQRLNLRWEWLYDVRGLSCPPETAASPADGYGAVQLFVQVAGRIRPGFSLADEWPAVARICRLVEGMPLALELAAAAARALPCPEIAAEIEQDLDVLAASLHDLPERHRSVRAAFEGSWRLLAAEEQQAMGRLAAFRGGFDREAARAVAGAPRAMLDALAEKSLLRRTPSGRYELHELLRQFAAERLAEEQDEDARARARHAGHYAGRLQAWQDLLHGDGQRAALSEMALEMENVRAAWKYAVERQQADLVSRSLEGLYRFYDLRGRFQEGGVAFALAAAAWRGPADPGSAHLLARLEVRQAMFEFRAGRYAAAQELAARSLKPLRRLGDAGEEALALSILGALAEEQGEYDRARTHYESALDLYRQAGDGRGQARTLDHLGDVARMVGAYDRAGAHYRDSLGLYQEIGDRAGIASALNSLGSDAGTRGDYEQARAYFEQSLALRRELDDRFGIAGASHNLGAVAYLLGDYEAARDLRQEALTICREIGFRWGVADALRHLGDAHRRLGQDAEARQLYEESLALKRELGHRRGLALVLSSLGSLEMDAGRLGRAREHLCRGLETAIEIGSPPVALAILADWIELLAHEGAHEQALELLALVLQHPATEQQTQDQARALAGGIESQLTAEAAADARQRGRAQTLEGAAGALLAPPHDW